MGAYEAHSDLLSSMDLAEGVVPHLKAELEKRENLQNSDIQKKIKTLLK